MGENNCKTMNVGGQAVIEGVMMRGEKHVVVSVRKENGKIVSKKERLKEYPKWFKWLFIRGIVNLISMLVVGIKALNWSAKQAGEDEEELSDFAIAMTLIVAIALALGLFLLLPYVLTVLLGIKEVRNPVWFNIVDGIIKVAILILYVYLIGLIKDIKRVFQYHGAEHKAVHCYEKGEKLTVENCKKYATLHPRCGTAFLLIVIIIGVLLFSFIPIIVKGIYPNIDNVFWLWKRAILFVCRIILLPIIAGVSYEILKLGAKKQDNWPFKGMAMPGLWLQKLTTKEPNKKQLEVAIVALDAVLRLETGKFK